MSDLNRGIKMQPVYILWAVFIAIFIGVIVFKDDEGE